MSEEGSELTGTKAELARLTKIMIDGMLFSDDENRNAFFELDPKLFTISIEAAWHAYHRLLLKQRAERELHCGPKPHLSEANLRIRAGKSK